GSLPGRAASIIAVLQDSGVPIIAQRLPEWTAIGRRGTTLVRRWYEISPLQAPFRSALLTLRTFFSPFSPPESDQVQPACLQTVSRPWLQGVLRSSTVTFPVTAGSSTTSALTSSPKVFKRSCTSALTTRMSMASLPSAFAGGFLSPPG